MRVSATAKREQGKDPEVRKIGQERACWTELELMLNIKNTKPCYVIVRHREHNQVLEFIKTAL